MQHLFKNLSATPMNKNWKQIIQRKAPIYYRDGDLRTDFERDYTRIIHCDAYKRLKHKTQVFFSPESEHICTRLEHVTHVESISYTIAKYLGLNTELTRAIATAHDIGHPPFGHVGEKILSSISTKEYGETFWHEKNGLYFVDNIELLEDNSNALCNLNLTYAVRDGIISHCGEIDENGLKPRDEFIDLNMYSFPNEYSPYTWEGCVVKIADKISYIGRDIQDAIRLGLLDSTLSKLHLNIDVPDCFNNTYVINYLITDLCENSTPEKGLCFSNTAFNILNDLKEFNYKNIYLAPKTLYSSKYFNLVINQIFDLLKSCYDSKNLFDNILKLSKFYPLLCKSFYDFAIRYYNIENKDLKLFKNSIICDLNNPKHYSKLIVSFISGMSDQFANKIYFEIIGFNLK